MSNIVAIPFNSIIHRFKIGDEITDAHDLRPHTLDDLKKRGFVVDPSERISTSPAAAAFSSSRSKFSPKSVEE